MRRSVVLNIGDAFSTRNSKLTYTCFGLGSCIGLFLQDRITGISGGAHILLDREGSGVLGEPGKYYDVGSALNRMLSQFRELGSDLQTLRAKIAGGANVIGTGYPVGAQNIQRVLSELINNKIYLAAQDVGGIICRNVKFDTDSGDMVVYEPGNKSVKVY